MIQNCALAGREPMLARGWAEEKEIRVGRGRKIGFVGDFFTSFSIFLLLPHLKQEEKSW